MFYRKNVGRTECLLRGLMGVMMIGGGLLWQGFTPLGVGITAAGALAILSGLFGYCPACAMMGRKPMP